MYAVDVLGAILFTDGDEKRSSSLAGMLSIAIDSFGDSQNFFHVFKSLRLQKLLNCDFIFARSFLGWLEFANAYSFSLPFSIINRNKPIFSFFVCLFVMFEDKCENTDENCQDRSRCRSRWENLDRGQF